MPVGGVGHVSLGVIVTYITGRFVTDVRATEFGIGFSLSVILPSFYTFYMDWLSAVMPFSLTAVVLLALGGFIATRNEKCQFRNGLNIERE